MVELILEPKEIDGKICWVIVGHSDKKGEDKNGSNEF